METESYTYPTYAKFLHLGMAAFGIAAFSTAELAEHGGTSPGYLLHAYLGLSLAAFVLVRVVRGFVGAGPMRFSAWSPLSRRQWLMALEDLRGLLRLKVPDRGMHQGLAGLTQAFGLMVFAWMALTGTAMFLLAGAPGGDAFELVEEVHELGEALIPLYLTLHVGSVVAHSAVGNPIWQRMWKFRDVRRQQKNPIPIADRHDMV